MANLKGSMRLFKSIKAISPVISILLTIIVAVVAGLILYAWSVGYLGAQKARAGTEIKIESVAFTRNDTECVGCHDSAYVGKVIRPYDGWITCTDSSSCHLSTRESYITGNEPYGIYTSYAGFKGGTTDGWLPKQTVAEHVIPADKKKAVCTSKSGCHTNIHDEWAGPYKAGSAYQGKSECYACHKHAATATGVLWHTKLIHTESTNCSACHGLPHGSGAVTIVIRNTGIEDVDLGDLYVNGVKYSYSLVSGDANSDGRLNVKESWSLRVLGLAWQPKSVVSEYKFEISTTTGVVSSRTVEPPTTTTYVP